MVGYKRPRKGKCKIIQLRKSNGRTNNKTIFKNKYKRHETNTTTKLQAWERHIKNVAR